MRLDHVFLGFLAPAATLGVYSVATMIGELLWKIEAAIGPVFFNRIAATKDSRERNELLGRILRVVLFSLIGISIPVLIVSHFVIKWGLGPDFADATPVLALLLPGIVFGSAFRILNKFFGATGKPWLITLSQLTALAFALVAYWVMIQSFGIFGAAISSTVVYSIATIAALRLFGKNYDGSVTDLLSGFSPARDVAWVISQFKRSVRPSTSS